MTPPETQDGFICLFFYVKSMIWPLNVDFQKAQIVTALQVEPTLNLFSSIQQNVQR